MQGDWLITWVDSGREPRNPPDKKYPRGVAVRAVPENHEGRTCKKPLPYPAARCGYYEIECRTCGIKAAVTTAGRVDDPRSLELACY